MARSATIILEARTEDARADIEQLQTQLQELEVEAVEAGGGFEGLSRRASTELAQTRQEAEQTAQAINQVSTNAAGTANSLGIELTQAAQDARFGVAGLANQLPQLQLEFQRLQSQSGGTIGALKTLGTSLIGPTGLIAAITLTLPWIADLVSGTQEAEQAAKEASGSVKDLTEAARGLVEIQTDQDEGLQLQLQVARDTLDEVERNLRDVQSEFNILQDLTDEGILQSILGTPEDIPLRQVGAARQIAEQTQVTLQDLQEAREEGADELRTLIEDRLETVREEKQELETSQELLQERITTAQAELRVREELDERVGQIREELRLALEAGQEAGLLPGFQSLEEILSNQSASNAERTAQAFNALSVTTSEAAQNLRFVRRFLRERRQQQRLGMPGQLRGPLGRAPTIGGTMLQSGPQNVAGQGLQAARQAGLISDFRSLQGVLGGQQQPQQGPQGLQAIGMTLEEIQNQFDVSEKKARQFKQAAQQEFGQVVNAAGQMGQAIVSALQGGKKEAEDIAGILLQGVGGVLSAIPGVGQIAGPVLSQLGGIVPSFQHGGRMPRTGMALVGEAGPELVRLGEGAEVFSNKESRDMMQSAGQEGNRMLVEEMQRVRNAIGSINVRLDTYSARGELNRVERQQELNTEYPTVP